MDVLWPKGEQHRGERPDRSPGRSASEAGKRSEAGPTVRIPFLAKVGANALGLRHRPALF